MPASSTFNFIHGVAALGSFSSALACFFVSIRLGGWQFIKENLIDGLCTDVWDGFFLSPKNLIAIGFLTYLPLHCYTNHVPTTIQLFSGMMGIPSYLFLIAVLLETSPVVIPLGCIVGLLVNFGISQSRLYLLSLKNHPPSPSPSPSPATTGRSSHGSPRGIISIMNKKPSVSFSPITNTFHPIYQSPNLISNPLPFNRSFNVLSNNDSSSSSSSSTTSSSDLNTLASVSPKDISFLSVPTLSPLSKRKRSSES